MAGLRRFGALQTDLFAFSADAPFVILKGLEPLMGTSWFSMEKHRTTPIRHSYKKYWVEITGGASGIATYWDQDILLFCVSQIINGVKNGDEVSRLVRFTGYDFFEFTGQKWIGARSYDNLVKALRRLRSTTVKTSITSDTEIAHGEQGSGWINSYRTLRTNDQRTGFQVELPEHIFNWAINKRNWLSLDRSYFDLMGGMERFLYIFARKATGYKNGDRWEESFDSIYEKSAATATIIKFRYNLSQIIKRQSIIGYHLEEYTCPRRGRVLTIMRDITHPLLLRARGKIRRNQLTTSAIDTQMKLEI